jgi:hypothetical protein
MNRLGKHMAALHMLIVFALCVFHGAFAAQKGAIVPVGILRPAADAQGRIIQATAPDGKVYPVFRPASGARGD